METWGNKVKKALARLGKTDNYLYTKPEQDWTHKDKALVISFLRKSKVAENTQMKDLDKIKEFFSQPIPGEDAIDTISMDIPLFLRMLEYAKEDAQEDVDLHDVTQRATELSKMKPFLSMEDYNEIVAAPQEIDEEEGYSKYLKDDPEFPGGKTPGLTPDVMSKILMKIADPENIDEVKKKVKEVLLEKKKKRDRCLRIADRKFDKPSAYKSGAVVRCRDGEIWKDLKEVIYEVIQEDESLYKWFKRAGTPGKEGGWVDCNAPIRKDGKITGYKSCGRKKGEKRAKYPSCRPTAAKCKDPGKGKKWGKTK
jgi:hypothetical protein